MCNDVQTVGALSAVNRGFTWLQLLLPSNKIWNIQPAHIAVSALLYVQPELLLKSTMFLMYSGHLVDPSKTVIVQTAPAVRAALGEEFGMEPGTL
jgi:NADP-reducing hydrogenase subunit HndD